MVKAKKNKNEMTAEEAISLLLKGLLADTYVLALKTHGYHWNVTGIDFSTLHALFEAQYNELVLVADELAERMRALDAMPEGSMAAFLKDTVIKEASAKKLTAKDMLKDLIKSHEQIRERLLAAEAFADEIDDVVTEGMLVDRIQAHDKTLWMLRSHLA